MHRSARKISVLMLYNSDWAAGATSIVLFIAVSNILFVYCGVELHRY